MDSFATLRELMELPGPAGQEQRVTAWLRERWSGRADQVWTTRVGNLLAHVGGRGPKLLIQAHADEIGFVVRSIDPNGFLWLTSGQGSGDPTKHYPVGQPALVLGRGEPVEGIFATATGHVLSDAQRQKDKLEFGDLFVDIGAGSRDEVVDRGIHVGAGVIWNPSVRRLGTRIYGKAIDDRVSLAVMTLLLDERDPTTLAYDLYFAATVQEEIGLVGDIPTVGEREMPTVLGAPTLATRRPWSTTTTI